MDRAVGIPKEIMHASGLIGKGKIGASVNTLKGMELRRYGADPAMEKIAGLARTSLGGV